MNIHNIALINDSKKILEFIYKSNLFDKVTLPKLNKKYIELFDHIKETYTKVKKSSIPIEHTNNKNIGNILKIITNSDSISQYDDDELTINFIAKETIPLITKLNKITNIKYKNTTIKIFDNNIINSLNKPFIRLSNIIYTLYDLYKDGDEHSQSLTVYIALTNIKKKIPPKNKIFGPNNVNGGVTFPQNFSLVYRKEENIKVLLHELLHLFNYQINYELQKKYKKNITKYLCYSEESDEYLNIDESFVELFATILNIIFIMLELEINSKKSLITLLNIERIWSLFQASKVIVFNGFDLYSELIQVNCKKIFYEKSNVMSYYIIKSCYLYFLDDFVPYFDNYISFKKILKFLNNKLFISTMNKMCRFFKKVQSNNKSNKSNNFIINTLRMTALEI